jgi:hypothetical protein
VAPFRPGHDHIAFAAPASGTDQPIAPIENANLKTSIRVDPGRPIFAPKKRLVSIPAEGRRGDRSKWLPVGISRAAGVASAVDIAVVAGVAGVLQLDEPRADGFEVVGGALGHARLTVTKAL